MKHILLQVEQKRAGVEQKRNEVEQKDKIAGIPTQKPSSWQQNDS